MIGHRSSIAGTRCWRPSDFVRYVTAPLSRQSKIVAASLRME